MPMSIALARRVSVGHILDGTTVHIRATDLNKGSLAGAAVRSDIAPRVRPFLGNILEFPVIDTDIRRSDILAGRDPKEIKALRRHSAREERPQATLRDIINAHGFDPEEATHVGHVLPLLSADVSHFVDNLHADDAVNVFRHLPVEDRMAFGMALADNYKVQDLINGLGTEEIHDWIGAVKNPYYNQAILMKVYPHPEAYQKLMKAVPDWASRIR